jgi:hypothetical protein
LARVPLSDLAERLLGRRLSRRARAAEDQANWDLQDSLPPAGRHTMDMNAAADIDAYARQVSDRALRRMREAEVTGPRLMALALGLQAAIRLDPDPDYFERVFYIRRDIEEAAHHRAERARSALPSPAPADRRAAIEDERQTFLDALTWEKESHLGGCFAVVADRLQDLGLTANRLSCLTGATKRLGFEGRLDDRAFRGFLRQLTNEARAGIALLDSLELLVGEFGRAPEAKFDARSQLPEIIYAFLLLPAVDSVWLQTALDMQERVVHKSVKRLADGGLISHWADRQAQGDRGREVRLWTATRFEKDFALTMNRPPALTPGNRDVRLAPAEIVGRVRDINLQVPMSVVFKRFDQEMVDIDREFSRIVGSLAQKIDPAGGSLSA